MKLTAGFGVFLRVSLRPGRTGEMNLIRRASTLGGRTLPRKNSRQIVIVILVPYGV